MLLSRDILIGAPIMSLQTGSEIGTISSAIIDPRNLLIVAFYCEGSLIDFQPALLHTSDIREFGEVGAIVDSSDVIMPADDLVRLKEILDFHFALEHKLVVNENNKKLGRVEDYLLDLDSFFILKLSVKPSLIHSLSIAHLTIDRSQIVNIDDEKITVKEATVKDTPVRASISKEAIENPFRHAKPASSNVHK